VTRGEVDMFCADVTAALGLLQGDKVKALAITSRKRAPALPDVAPFAELGLPNFEQTGYVGVMVTGGTPPEVIAKLNTSINEVIHEPAFAKQFAALGYDMVGGSIEGFAKFLREDMNATASLRRRRGSSRNRPRLAARAKAGADDIDRNDDQPRAEHQPAGPERAKI
jgi:tripartite-type tricarboxylate transporter receptor subunit TctC